jgi:hypothetical protein
VKAPDKYTGGHYVVWACVTQFDAATGSDSFRGQASYKKLTYWYSDGDNALFNGDEDALAGLDVSLASRQGYDCTCSSRRHHAGGRLTLPARRPPWMP